MFSAHADAPHNVPAGRLGEFAKPALMEDDPERLAELIAGFVRGRAPA